jgi:hypothetical protein
MLFCRLDDSNAERAIPLSPDQAGSDRDTSCPSAHDKDIESGVFDHLTTSTSQSNGYCRVILDKERVT